MALCRPAQNSANSEINRLPDSKNITTRRVGPTAISSRSIRRWARLHANPSYVRSTMTRRSFSASFRTTVRSSYCIARVMADVSQTVDWHRY